MASPGNRPCASVSAYCRSLRPVSVSATNRSSIETAERIVLGFAKGASFKLRCNTTYKLF